ncbi:MAG: hypothetical protein AABX52_03555 [Nanoarchaeota archaeon]
MHNRKQAQMEIMGLTIIVILVSIGVLFALSIINKPVEDIKAGFEQKRLATTFLSTLLKTTACQKKTFGALLQDCASDQLLNCGGLDSCAFTRSNFQRIFKDTLVPIKKGYYLQITGNPQVESITQGSFGSIDAPESCPGERDSASQPIPLPGGGSINVEIQICDMFITAFAKTACTPSWSCTNLGTCINGIQNKHCIDLNDCRTNASRPAIEEICTPPCAELWKCESFGICTSINSQTRNCTDMNICNTTNNRPGLFQQCVCNESWTCAEFGACNLGFQTKNCTDNTPCGTNLTKPATQQNCTIPCTESWTCTGFEPLICPISRERTRTCTDTNRCGTNLSKSAEIETCTCMES